MSDRNREGMRSRVRMAYSPVSFLLTIQVLSLAIGSVTAYWLSGDWRFPTLYLVSCLLLSSTAIVASIHPDAGVSFAIAPSAAGIVFGFPFLLEPDNPIPLLAMMIVVLLIGSVTAAHARSIIGMAIWKSSIPPGRTQVEKVLSAEIAVSAVYILVVSVAVAEADALSHPLTWLLALALPAIAWYVLPTAQEGLYLQPSADAREDGAVPTKLNDNPTETSITKTMILVGFSIAVLFVIGMFLPIFFAYFESLRPYYAIGGTLYVAALSTRALTLRSVR